MYGVLPVCLFLTALVKSLICCEGSIASMHIHILSEHQQANSGVARLCACPPTPFTELLYERSIRKNLVRYALVFSGA